MRVVASPGGRGILGGEMRGRARVYLGMRYGGGGRGGCFFGPSFKKMKSSPLEVMSGVLSAHRLLVLEILAMICSRFD